MSETALREFFALLTPEISLAVLALHLVAYLAIRSWLRHRLLSKVGVVITQYTPEDVKPTVTGVLLDRTFRQRHVVAGVYELVARRIFSLTSVQERGKTVPAFECRYPIFSLKEMGLRNWELRLKNILFENDTVISQQTARDRLVAGWLKLWKDVFEDARPWFTVDPNRLFWRRLGWASAAMLFYLGIGYGAGYAQIHVLPFVSMALCGVIVWYGLKQLPFPWYYTQQGYTALAQLYGWRQYYGVEHNRSVFEEKEGTYPEWYAWSILFHGCRKWEKRIFTIFPERPDTSSGRSQVMR